MYLSVTSSLLPLSLANDKAPRPPGTKGHSVVPPCLGRSCSGLELGTFLTHPPPLASAITGANRRRLQGGLPRPCSGQALRPCSGQALRPCSGQAWPAVPRRDSRASSTFVRRLSLPPAPLESASAGLPPPPGSLRGLAYYSRSQPLAYNKSHIAYGDTRFSGPEGTRTLDLLNAIETRSQLRHRPTSKLMSGD